MSYLKFHRLRLGLTQKQVAKRAHMSQAAYCEIECGIKKPHPDTHVRIAEALERPIDEFTAKLYGVKAEEMFAAK